jgi:hypothetical protein
MKTTRRAFLWFSTSKKLIAILSNLIKLRSLFSTIFIALLSEGGGLMAISGAVSALSLGE